MVMLWKYVYELHKENINEAHILNFCVSCLEETVTIVVIILLT